MPGRVMSREAGSTETLRSTVANLGHAWCRRDRDPSPSVLYRRHNGGPKFIDTLSYFPLGIFRGRFQPKIVDLGEDAILAADPAVAEGFPVGLGCDTLGFFFQRGEQLLGSFVQRGGREAF